jgi:diguanylate cyclase (GGDEF)-like protein
MRAAQLLLVLLATAAPLILAAVLRGLPPSSLGDAGLGWVVPALGVGVAVAGSLATLSCLVAGLRDGSLAALLLAGASAAVVGGAIGLASGTAGLSLAVTGISGFVLAAVFAERVETLVHGRRTRLAMAAATVLVGGAVAVAEIAPATSAVVGPVGPALLLAAAALAAAGAISATRTQMSVIAGVTAVAAVSLWLARGADAELVLGLVALLGASLLMARSMLGGASVVLPTLAGDVALPALAEHVADGVLRFDGHLQLRAWNPAAAGLLALDDASAGARLEDLLGISLAELPIAGGTPTAATVAGDLEAALHHDGGGLTVVLRDPGTSRDADRLGRELRATIEELFGMRRMVELQRAELERAAAVDALTGVASRTAILERLEMEVAEARRYQHPVAIVLLDVDRFSALNAAHGVAAGDAALREVALRIRLRVRQADSLGRWGSDGFVAILPHTDEAGAATFADVLRGKVALRPLRLDDVEVAVTISAGVAVMRPGEELDRDGFLGRAEEALSSARSAGGDTIALDRLHGLARLEERRAPRPRPAAAADEAGDDAGT